MLQYSEILLTILIISKIGGNIGDNIACNIASISYGIVDVETRAMLLAIFEEILLLIHHCCWHYCQHY